MAEKAATRSQASTMALVGQVATALLAAMVVAAALLWPRGDGAGLGVVSWREVQGRAEERVKAREEAKDGSSGAGEPAVSVAAAASMLTIAGRVAPPQEDIEDPEESGEETVADAGDEPGDGDEAAATEGLARFLGIVRAGSTRWGLFRVGEPQGMVAEGEKRSFAPRGRGRGDDPVTLEVVRVSDDEAVVLEDGVRRTLRKEAKSTTVVASPPASSDVASRRAAKPTETPDGLPQRPRIQDFRNEDGSYDRQAYAAALRQFNTERANAARRNVPGGRGGGVGIQRIGGGDGDDRRSAE